MVALPTQGASENTWAESLWSALSDGSGFLEVFLRSTGKPKITWATVSESGGTYTLGDNYNVATAARDGGTVGKVLVTFDTVMGAATYAVLATAISGDGRFITIDDLATTGFTAYINSASGTNIDDPFSFMIVEI